MFDTITETSKIRDMETVSSTPVSTKQAWDAAESVNEPQAPQNKQKDERQGKTERLHETKGLSQALLNELEEDIALIHGVGLRFSVHEDTGRTMVKVINKDTDKTIREFPPERILDLAAKMDEMIGILFDETV